MDATDLRDQRWLDQRISNIGSGVDAVKDIIANWTEGSNVGRLHLDQTWFEYVKSRVSDFQLGSGDVPELLATNLSHGGIAALTGMTQQGVSKAARRIENNNPVVIPEPRVSIQGKTVRSGRPRKLEVPAITFADPPAVPAPDPTVALSTAMKALVALSSSVRQVLAGATPEQHAKLRVLAKRVGRIASDIDVDIFVVSGADDA